MLASFKGIVGNAPQQEYLSRVIDADQLAHAYCFSGSSGVGKRLVVEAIAGHFLEGNIESHPNVVQIKRLVDEKTEKKKESISVEQIRTLRERLSLSSFGGGKKIAIIHEADTMTIAAQNALLKTLEEPTEDTHIFLLVSDPKRLLDTILSRSVHLRFQRVPREDICSLLRDKGLSKERAHMLAGLVDGRPVLIDSVLETHKEEMQERLDRGLSFIEGNVALRLREAEKIAKAASDREEVKLFVHDVRRILHDVLASALQLNHIAAFSEFEERLQTIADRHDAHHWSHALKATETSLDHIQTNGNATIALEHLSLSL